MIGWYPEAKGAAESAEETEETLLSVGHRGGKRQRTSIYQEEKHE